MRVPVSAEAVSLESGAVLLRVGLAERLRTRGPAEAAAQSPETAQVPASSASTPALPAMSGPSVTGLELSIRATEDDLFVLNQSLTKLRQALDGGTIRCDAAFARGAGVARSSRDAA